MLPPGDYYFTSVEVAAEGSIVITGPTNFYLAGPAHFTGRGITNPGQITANLTIYSDGSDVHINGNHGFYGAILAPNSDVTLRTNYLVTRLRVEQWPILPTLRQRMSQRAVLIRS